VYRVRRCDRVLEINWVSLYPGNQVGKLVSRKSSGSIQRPENLEGVPHVFEIEGCNLGEIIVERNLYNCTRLDVG